MDVAWLRTFESLNYNFLKLELPLELNSLLVVQKVILISEVSIVGRVYTRVEDEEFLGYQKSPLWTQKVDPEERICFKEPIISFEAFKTMKGFKKIFHLGTNSFLCVLDLNPSVNPPLCGLMKMTLPLYLNVVLCSLSIK